MFRVIPGVPESHYTHCCPNRRPTLTPPYNLYNINASGPRAGSQVDKMRTRSSHMEREAIFEREARARAVNECSWLREKLRSLYAKVCLSRVSACLPPGLSCRSSCRALLSCSLVVGLVVAWVLNAWRLMMLSGGCMMLGLVLFDGANV